MVESVDFCYFQYYAWSRIGGSQSLALSNASTGIIIFGHRLLMLNNSSDNQSSSTATYAMWRAVKVGHRAIGCGRIVIRSFGLFVRMREYD
jgi:hypothetical protein